MEAQRKKKIRKRLLITLSVLVIIGVIGFVMLDKFAEAYARKSLDKIISDNPEQLYEYSYDRLRINLAQGDLSIHNIRVTPKKAAMDSLLAGGIKVLVDLSIDKFSIRGFEIMEMMNDEVLDVDQIHILGAQVKYFVNPSVKNIGSSLALNDLLSKDLKSATAGQLLISNARVEWHDVLEDLPKLKMDSVFLEFDSIYVDSVTLTEPFAFQFSEARFEARQFDQELSELYRAKAEKIYLDYQKNVLIIQRPELVPTKGRYNYGEITKTETDLFSIKGESIEIEGFVTGTFIENGLLTIPKIRLNGIDLEIFRDKHLPDSPFKKIPLPITAIKKIPFPIKVDSIFFTNCKVNSTQLDTLNDKAGTVFFHQFTGVLTNLTNDSASVLENNVMSVKASSLFMGRGSLRTQLRFFLDSPYDQFEMSAHLGRMDATVISPLLDSLLLIRITSGKIHSLSMDIRGNDDRATGTMDFSYSNLKIDVMKIKSGGNSNWFLRTLANTVIRSSNVSGQKGYKQGIIDVERRKDRAIFNYLWKAAKGGLISTSTPIKSANKSTKKKKKK